MIRCCLGIECPIEVICLVQRCNDPNSRPVALRTSDILSCTMMKGGTLTEVASEPVLQTVITFNPFFPPPRFCHNHSAPFFPISIHLAKSSPCTALHVSLTFSFNSSPPNPAFSPSLNNWRIRFNASERLTAVGRDDCRWSSIGLRCVDSSEAEEKEREER